MDRQAGRGKGRWRREREMEETKREHGELNRKERKVESSPDPEKTETKKRGLKGARGCVFFPKGGREVKSLLVLALGDLIR